MYHFIEQKKQPEKQAITGPDVMLYHPDWNAPFELNVDASKLGCGAMLALEKDSPSDLHAEHIHQLNHVGQLCTINSLQ